MKILVIHASAGAGHFKAAEALYHGLKKSSSHEAVLADALDYTSPFFKNFYKKSYAFFVSRVPWLWGFFFYLLDISGLQPLIRSARRLYNTVNAAPLHAFLDREDFDYILTTHFLPAEVVSALKRKKRIRAKLVTVITDFDVHKIWLTPETDIYVVASAWTQERLKALGVPPQKVCAFGIPTAEPFAGVYDMAEAKKSLGLKEDLFTVLIATGSFGIGPIERIIEALPGFQLIVVCGHNRGLFERLNAKKNELVKVTGLVDNMPELMAASNVMVTKPGGLSISEALVRQLPLVFFNAIPGQETHNVRVLQEHDIGFAPEGVEGIAGILQKLKSSPDFYLSVLKKTHQLARPSAVGDIISLIK